MGKCCSNKTTSPIITIIILILFTDICHECLHLGCWFPAQLCNAAGNCLNFLKVFKRTFCPCSNISSPKALYCCVHQDFTCTVTGQFWWCLPSSFSLNGLSLTAGVSLSVCISSKGCLHRYFIHQSCLDKTTTWSRRKLEDWSKSAVHRRPSSILTHGEELNRSLLWLHVTVGPLVSTPFQRDVSSPLLEIRLLQSRITFDIYTLLKDAVDLQMQPELCRRKCSAEVWKPSLLHPSWFWTDPQARTGK